MKINRTELVFILDRSGSMAGLESDTIGGFNSMLEKQQKEEGEAIITTVLFDNEYQLLHDRFDIHNIRPLTNNEYFVRGSTALLDAVGKTINKTVNVQKHIGEGERADKVLFVIITDGMENASCEYSKNQVKHMIEREKEKYGWEFIFLGANIDAVATARSYGIHSDRAANYYADAMGTKVFYSAVSEAVSEYRTKGNLKKEWKKEIDKDYKNRNK